MFWGLFYGSIGQAPNCWGSIAARGMTLVRHSSGIDWMDVKNLWSALEGIHELTVELTVTTRSQQPGGALAISMIAWVPTVEAHRTKEVAKIDGF